MTERSAHDGRRVARAAWLAVSALVLATGCGGGSSGGSSGGGTPTSPSPSSATITITSSGVTPQAVTISAGSRVTFVNNDSAPHDMASDPHPEHADCPAINDVGFLAAGQTKTTGNLNTPRTCRFHDHNRPSVASLQGTITIQ